MEKKLSGAQLAESLKSGDIVAFRKLYDLYWPRLSGLAFKYLQSKEDAEEVVQDVFLKLWQKRDTLDVDRPLKGFLFTMAKNKILNKIRERAKGFGLTEIQETSGHNHSTEDEVIYGDLLALSETAIQQLAPRRREIFNLSRKGGLSYKEIADELHISPKTVEKQMSAAIRDLKKYMQLHTDIVFMLGIPLGGIPLLMELLFLVD